MAFLRRSCAQTLLLAALAAGTCFAAFLRHGRDHSAGIKVRVQTAKQATGSSYGPPACTPGTPQFPNYILPMKIDPARMMGKWYLYMEWLEGISDTRTNINIVINQTNLVKGSLTWYPGSNTKAIAMEQVYGTFSVANNQCNTITTSYLDYLTVDGQMQGFGLLNGTAVPDTSLVMSTDYETYTLFYECGKYDTVSGICLDPYAYVYTRERTDKIPVSTANNIANVVSQTLGPYCLTADLMKKLTWLNDLADCPTVAASDDCYVTLRDTYLKLAAPDFPSDIIIA